MLIKYVYMSKGLPKYSLLNRVLIIVAYVLQAIEVEISRRPDFERNASIDFSRAV